MKPKQPIFLDIPNLDDEDYKNLEKARTELVNWKRDYPDTSMYVCYLVPEKTSNKIMLKLTKSDCKTVFIWYYLQTGEFPENSTDYRIQWVDYLLARRSTK